MNIKKKIVVLFFLSVLPLLLFFGKEAAIRETLEGETEYGFSLEEIRERIECIYRAENALEIHRSSRFGELGRLPQDKCVNIYVYLAKGNRILFLPECRVNMEMDKEGAAYKVYYSEEMEGCLFYLMCDWGVHESGVPLNSLESSTLRYCMVADGKSTHPSDMIMTGAYDGLYDMDDLSYLGKTQADFSEGIPSGIHPIEVSGNGYIDIMAEYVTNKLAQAGEYGKYVIYLNDMHRVQQEKRSFGETECYMDCVIEGNGRKEYAEFIIYDHGDMDGKIFPLSGPHLEGSQGYFSDYHAGDENREYIEKIMERERGVVTLEVARRAEENIEKEYSDSDPVCGSDIDFRVMPAGELARQISYICSYSEWFGMAELGSRVGKFSSFDGQEVIMYSWINTGRVLFFIPANKVNTLLKREDGEICPVYINETGDMEFYKLENKQFADSSGQMDTSMITMDSFSTHFIESFMRIGKTEKIAVEELTKLEMPPVGQDRFVRALVSQVTKLLEQAEKKGTYTVWIGEYDSVYSNQACISAAVTGEHDEYYFRYLIVGYGDGQYYFWPVGFGTDGSLEECAGERHGMNQKCIERTKLLNRMEIEIVL